MVALESILAVLCGLLPSFVRRFSLARNAYDRVSDDMSRLLKVSLSSSGYFDRDELNACIYRNAIFLLIVRMCLVITLTVCLSLTSVALSVDTNPF